MVSFLFNQIRSEKLVTLEGAKDAILIASKKLTRDDPSECATFANNKLSSAVVTTCFRKADSDATEHVEQLTELEFGAWFRCLGVPVDCRPHNCAL